jgi:tripartite-type tricarboxylate transporter receptor subunit TctC
MFARLRKFSLGCGLLALAAVPGGAQAAPSFEGKVVSVYISSSPGGGLDLYARTYARHVSKFLPGNPTMVPRNQPGAGGIILANQLASTLPKDGTAVAGLTNGLYLSQLLGVRNVAYDASKFNWIGSLAPLPLLLLSSERSGIKTAEDMFKKDFAVSVTGPGSYGFLVLSAVKNILGAKIKIISGYRSGGANRLAMERGEVDGTASVQWTVQNQRDWIKRINANILSQIALKPYPDLKNVSLLGDLAKDQETKRVLNMFIAPAEIGRGFALPPDVSADVVDVHRTAFSQMTKDPAFLAEAKKLTLDIEVMDGKALQATVIESGDVSPQQIAKARAAVSEAKDSMVKRKQSDEKKSKK